MNGEFKDTTKIIRKRKGTTVVNKEKNCIPKFDNPHNPNGRRGNSGNGSASPYQEPNYEKTKQRRKYAIEEMANNTFDTEHSCFLTITFDGEKWGKENTTNLKWTYNEIKNFIKRLNYNYDGFAYIMTYARQNNTNWHYHMLCNLPPQATEKSIQTLWGHGRVDKSEHKSEKHFENSIKYLIKNLKSCEDELKGKKAYLCSRNVKRNIRICSWKDEDRGMYTKERKKIIAKGVDSFEWVREYEQKIGVVNTTEYPPNITVNDILFNAELTDELKMMGYKECVVHTKVYFYKGGNDDVFPAPQFAVPKSQKKK